MRDFFVVAREGPRAIFDEVCELAATRLPAHYGLDPAADVQVLAPMHKGPVGIDALNDELRARLNPDGERIEGTPLRVGDKVMQTRNSYEHDLFNGERGVLVAPRRRPRPRALRRRGRPPPDAARRRARHAAPRLRGERPQGAGLAGAARSSCRSSRGHRIMLTRNLVYTAVTRAQEVCVVVGEPCALAAAVRRTDARRRHTRLRELVAGGGRAG